MPRRSILSAAERESSTSAMARSPNWVSAICSSANPFELHEHNCVLSGNVAGEVFVACVGFGPRPPPPSSCWDLLELERPVHLVTAKYGL